MASHRTQFILGSSLNILENDSYQIIWYMLDLIKIGGTFWVLAFPDRCRSFLFRTAAWLSGAAMSTIRVRFGCLLFRTAACLSGPQCLQLECVLSARFSGPLHAFPDRNRYD